MLRILPKRIAEWLLWRRAVPSLAFEGSERYWQERYAVGGNSGGGSYGALAKFKASVLNDFVVRKGVKSVIEFGCGDGNQLSLAAYPGYIGVDVSLDAVRLCQKLFAEDSTKQFLLVSEYEGQKGELSLSLDVIYHLVEDSVFDGYMRRLFGAADRFVVIYSTNFASELSETARHVRHRRFTDWVEEHCPQWSLHEVAKNTESGSGCDFYFYGRT